MRHTRFKNWGKGGKTGAVVEGERRGWGKIKRQWAQVK